MEKKMDAGKQLMFDKTVMLVEVNNASYTS